MRMYVHGTSSYRSDTEETVVKKELKETYGVDVRRKDEFIHLGLLGALRLQKEINIKKDDELYITSGVGNIKVLEKIHDYVIHKKGHVKLFDFINMLGNTTSFYIAEELKMEGKNIFQIANNFTYFNTLVTAYASLQQSHNAAVLGSIDLVSDDPKTIKNLLAVPQSSEVVSSVNYQKVSLIAENALCAVEFDTKFHSLAEVTAILENTKSTIKVSQRCRKLIAYQEKNGFIETEASYVLNSAIDAKEDTLYVECYDHKYKVLTIKNLP